MHTKQELYSFTQAAQVAGVSRDYIRARVADGTLPAFYNGTGRRAVKRIRRDHLSKLFKPIPAMGFDINAVALPGVRA